MNPIVFGRETWNFLHNLPWIFPKEILSDNEWSDFFMIVYFTIKLLACKSCCSDAQDLIKKTDFLRKVGICLGNKTIITRSCLSKWIFEIHTMVNEKLKKKVFSKDWKCSIKKRPDWLQSFMKMLTINAWNFPSPEDWKKIGQNNDKEISSKYLYDKEQVIFYYKFYFEYIVPLVFSKISLDKFYENFLITNPLTRLQLSNRINFSRWFCKFRKSASQDKNFSCIMEINYQDNFEYWSFEDLELFLENTRSKEDCGKIDRPGTIFQGCQ